MGRAAAKLGHHTRHTREYLAQCRSRHLRDQDIARRNARKLTLAIDHARPPRTPADARGMPAESGVAQPDVIRHGRWLLQVQWTRLEQLESRVVERPLDLHRQAHDILGLAQQAAQLDHLCRAKALRGGPLAGGPDHRSLVFATDGVKFRTRGYLAQRSVSGERIPIRRHFALGDGRAESPCRVDDHFSIGRLTEPAARRARGHQRLDQQGHRGIRRIQIMGCHVAQRARRPQCRPARTHGSQEISLVFQVEKALELARKTGSKTVFDECGRAHHNGHPGRFHERSPGGEQRFEDVEHDRLPHQPQLHVERAAARLRAVFSRKSSACGRFQPQGCDLHAISLGIETEAAGSRQAGVPEGREVCGLGTEAVGVGCHRGGEGNNELCHGHSWVSSKR